MASLLTTLATTAAAPTTWPDVALAVVTVTGTCIGLWILFRH